MREYLLEGAYDLHVHTSPDIVERKVDHIEAAKRCIRSGMKGYAVKSHYSITTDRAMEAKRTCPNCDAVAGIALNTTVGGLNPVAVEYAISCGAKIVWFPTMDAPKEQAFIIQHAPDLVAMQMEMKRRNISLPDTSLLDQACQLKQEVKDILAITKKHNVIVATGHISHEECFALAHEAYRQGVTKLVITHANLPATRYKIEEQKKLIDLGATIERAYIVLYNNLITIEEEASEIKAVGAEHVFLSSDFGRPNAPYFDEGLLAYSNSLIDCGLDEKDIRTMIAENPTNLLN